MLNYGEYMEPAVLRQFEEETGIRVLYEEATTPEEMYSKYTSSTIPYDLICSSDYMIERLISGGETVELDRSRMEHVGQHRRFLLGSGGDVRSAAMITAYRISGGLSGYCTILR